jgi:hypothetical protein
MMMTTTTFLCTEVSPHMVIYRRNIYGVSSFLITNTMHGKNDTFYTDIFNLQKVLRHAEGLKLNWTLLFRVCVDGADLLRDKHVQYTTKKNTRLVSRQEEGWSGANAVKT